MANHGVGNKFVSVNLNKSYGQSSNHQHQYYTSHSSSHGSNRGRNGGGLGGGGGGGGGMVVLSRPRSSQKSGPKLSVPPPLNLPSLRKEHERFDSTGSGAGTAGGGISGTGSRPTSSGMGWSKPAPIALQEKEGLVGDQVSDGVDHGSHGGAAVSKGPSGAYMPPSVRSGPSYSVSVQTFPHLDKPTVLRGEDFPSLKAALPSVSGPEKKQKDSLNLKQKHPADELYDEPRAGSRSSTQSQYRSDSFGNGLGDNGGKGHGLNGSRASDQAQKQEDYFPGPLPLVRLNPRSDWADDERDTGHGYTDRGNDHGYSKRDAYWDRDFDMPRAPLLPHRPTHKLVDKWGQRDNETGKRSSGEVTKIDHFNRDVRIPSREGREGNSLRASSQFSKEGFGSQDIASDRSLISARPTLNREKESRYTPSHFRDNAQDSILRRDVGYSSGGKPPGSNTTDTFGSRVTERNTWEQNNRYNGNSFRNGLASKSSFSSGSSGLPDNDPILNFGREKRSFSKNEKLYVEDSFGAGSFDGHDPFSSSLVGVVKRKKDVLKQTDFHDPVRESFEAELERVQKMQEMERQRVVDEQERALELARREEEERLRVAREQEDLQRRLEEEAREASWRAEQERLESVRKVEEQRIAREEEKRRMQMEEERRKQAAKQKLLELEERIAKRQAEASKSGSNSSVVEERISELVKERDILKAADVDDWEDGERMVERITTSASETSGLNRPYEGSAKPHFSRDSSSPFSDRGRAFNSWKRDVFPNGNSLTFSGQDTENGNHSPRQDGSAIGRPFERKDYNAGAGFVSSKAGYRTAIAEHHLDEQSHSKEQRWDIHGDGDHFGRISDIESDYRENLAGNYGAIGWGQHARGNQYPLYPERFYQNHEEGLPSYGRSRFPMRQPRVLPPPTMYSTQKALYRGDSGLPDPSNYRENALQYSHPVRSVPTIVSDCDGGSQDRLVQPATVNPQLESIGNEVQKLDEDIASCASQSSLSVSSPPDSPINLSHDDLDDSGDSIILPSVEGQEVGRSGLGKDPLVLPTEAGKENMFTASNSISAGEDEEWNVDSNEPLQEQEEYDEDGDGYQEEDEMHETDGGNIVLSRDFKNMHLEEKEPSNMNDNLVLGFNEGVEVRMPNNESERCSRNENTAFALSQDSVGMVAERGSFDGMHGAKTLQDVPHVGLDDSATVFQETEKAAQDTIIQPNETPKVSPTSEVLHASSSYVSASHIVTSSVNPTSYISSGQTILSSPSAAPNQAEIPIKLPFGLFSGPSLIPSPVPAIQIGSIQMPLHLHPQVGPSLTHMHPSQPLFQFGQLRYTPPISQGVLPLAPQSMSFVQPNLSNNFPNNQNAGVPQSIQQAQDTSSHGSVSRESGKTAANNSASSFPSQDQGSQNSAVRNIKPSSDYKDSESQHHNAPVASQSVMKERDSSGSRAHGKIYGNRGKRQVFTVKNSNPRSFHSSDASRYDSGGYQRRARYPRTEFRVRENADKKLADGVLPLSQANHLVVDEKLNANEKRTGYSTRNGVRKAPYVDKSRRSDYSEGSGSGPVGSREIDSGNKGEKSAGKESSMKSQNIPHSGGVNLKRNIHDNVDASLQSGIVRVFEQPGIETPSDEDDFIEVRSKRQMLNDRREQREKEIRAKSRVPKLPRKPRSNMQSTIGLSSSNKGSGSASGEAAKTTRSNIAPNEGFNSTNIGVSTGFTSGMGSRPLAPIGTLAVKNDAQTVKSIQTRSLSTPSSGGTNVVSGFIFESKKEILDNVHTPFSTWGNSGINQQVMSLTQTQLDDAMKPVQFESCASVGDQTSSANEPSMPSSSILTKDKSFSSAGSPVNSLLAGEKIQFGVVTTPAVLPSSSIAVSHGIGPPGPTRSEKQISRNLSAPDDNCTLFFEKGKHSNDSCIHLEDCEAAAEAAASAVAVAAITSDEVVASGLGTSAISASDTKSFVAGDRDGSAGGPHIASQTKSEESLSVALPADLSVENPPISLWPPLSSPQNSSGQMISHFPGGPSSHFPFYEMNPMLGAPIFAFGPHEESASTQSQTQNSNAPTSSPLGTWQQCHPSVDSFYGPPAGFTGPFISPPGGIQGLQGPPQMVFYKHFAPVGQFGQVGLSFMGTTYIPSGKQPDWKHNPVSSGMCIGESDMSGMNMASSQCNPTNMTAPVQHLAPGSPLLPMPSPLAMFDVSPFQARWSHVPASPLQSVPLSVPLQQQQQQQQQAEGLIPSQYNQGPSVDPSLTGNKFHELQSSTPSDNSRRFPVASDGTVSQLPDELGLVEPSNSRVGASTQSGVVKSSSLNPVSDVSKKPIIQNSGGSTSNVQNTGSTFKTHSSQQKNPPSQHYGYSSGYNHQRGSSGLQKNSSGEWSHRRMGYQGRNQSSGGDKNFPASKVKQIYVAKQPTNGPSTTS